MITMLLAMVVLGFGSVYLIDGVSRFLNQGKVGDYATSELWDKLVSRMLDRDVPRPSRPTPKVIPAPEPVAAPVSAPEKRAELRAERPEAYARQSRTLDQVRGAQRDEPSRRRIDAILEKAGVKAD